MTLVHVQNVTSSPGPTSTMPEKTGVSRSLFGATRGSSGKTSAGSRFFGNADVLSVVVGVLSGLVVVDGVLVAGPGSLPPHAVSEEMERAPSSASQEELPVVSNLVSFMSGLPSRSVEISTQGRRVADVVVPCPTRSAPDPYT